MSTLILSCLPWVTLLLCSFIMTRFFYNRRFQMTATIVATLTGADTKSVEKTENGENPGMLKRRASWDAQTKTHTDGM